MRAFFTFLVLLLSGVVGTPTWSQTIRQDFETSFAIQSFPEAFLEGWYGNEVRDTRSRIFQTNTDGLSGSRALAIQPISSFEGEVTFRVRPADFEQPRLRFWARSKRNGSGDKPALVFVSFSPNLMGPYADEQQLGTDEEFENADQFYRLYVLELPDALQQAPEVFVRIRIGCGSGTGSCARWMMDAVEFGDLVDDRLPPRLVRARGYRAQEVELLFSEPLDPVFSQLQLNYQLGTVAPEEVVLIRDSVVVMGFEEELQEGENYQLSIRQLADRVGNFLADTSLTFTFRDPTSFGYKDLIINELMPAPKAGFVLPNVEYIELFHAGDKPFRLEGIELRNSRRGTFLEDQWMEPGAYLLLARRTQAAQLEPYGQVLGLSSWPALLNSGDEVRLYTSTGELIDQLAYTTATWGGREWSSGGYSLEVVNPFLLCFQDELLLPSQAESRGTPGRANSVLDLTMDTEAPDFERFSFVSRRELHLEFSEPIQPLHGESAIAFSPAILVDSTAVAGSRLSVYFEVDFPENSLVTLTLEGIADCGGNQLPAMTVPLFIPSQASQGDIVLSELLFNPRVGSPKFVEIHNRTDKYLEIGGWKLGRMDEQGAVEQIRELSEESLVLSPKAYLCISSDVRQVQLDYPKSAMGDFHPVSSLPSYPISGGTVVLLDASGEIVEEFSYDEDLHHPLLREPKGVSLERVSFDSPAGVRANWHSASGSEDYGTPGRENSQQIPSEFEAERIQLDPVVFDPEGSHGNTFTSIRYQLDQPGWVGTFQIFDISGTLVHVLTQNEVLGTEGLYTWTGSDGHGRRLRPGYYILLVELYDLEGRQQTIKKTLIIAQQLR